MNSQAYHIPFIRCFRMLLGTLPSLNRLFSPTSQIHEVYSWQLFYPKWDKEIGICYTNYNSSHRKFTLTSDTFALKVEL